MKLLENHKINDIEKILFNSFRCLFLNYKLSELKNITPSAALKHQNGKWEKNISMNSATLMNQDFGINWSSKIIFNSKFKNRYINTSKFSCSRIINFKMAY